MVGQHDAAAADADGGCLIRYMADEDGCCRTGESADAVVFCQPEAFIAEALYELRRLHAAGDGVASGFAGSHTNQIEYRNL